MTALRDVLYPQLRQWPPAQRERIWRSARAVPFDVIELLGIATGMVVVTGLAAFASSHLAPPGRSAAALASLAIAVPLLALIVGPFLMRRTRRALRQAAAAGGR